VCQEFIRVPDTYPQGSSPGGRYCKSLAALYDPDELGQVSLAAQIMGGCPETLADVARALVVRGAPRVDLNCGCPANCVTGKGAGSSLLKDPEHVFACLSAIVAAVHDQHVLSGEIGAHPPVVSVKMRSGFNDAGLMRENLLAAQEAGVAFLTLHPRTKQQGYKGQAAWELIACAKETLCVPVVGNGDVTTPQAAMALKRETNCDAIMIGRGCVSDPLLFQRIRSSWAGGDAYSTGLDEPHQVEEFIRSFAHEVTNGQGKKERRGSALAKQSNEMGRIKQVSNYLFQSNEQMAGALKEFLRTSAKESTMDDLVNHAVGLVHEYWGRDGLVPRGLLVNHLGGQTNSRANPLAGGDSARSCTRKNDL